MIAWIWKKWDGETRWWRSQRMSGPHTVVSNLCTKRSDMNSTLKSLHVLEGPITRSKTEKIQEIF